MFRVGKNLSSNGYVLLKEGKKMTAIPTKCSKCGNEGLQKKELSFPGKLEIGRYFPFDAFICVKCGFTEFFSKEPTWTAVPH